MPFLAYYDGSGTHGDSKVLTLAGFAAPQRIWATFNNAWRKVLDSHGVAEPHMREFGSMLNHGDECVRRLTVDLFNIIGSLREENFTAYSCIVPLEEYAIAKRIIPDLKSPEVLCVDFCVGGLQLTAEDLAEPEPILVHFDENEPFLKHLHRAWSHARKNNLKARWAQQIQNVRGVRSTLLPIQAADLFAWTLNRYHSRADNPFWAASTIIAAKHVSRVYDCNGILSVYESGGQVRGSGIRIDSADKPRLFEMRLRLL